MEVKALIGILFTVLMVSANADESLLGIDASSAALDSNSTEVNARQYWVEANVGYIGGSNIQLKTRDGYYGWSLGAYNYTNDNISTFRRGALDESTGEEFNTSFKALALTRLVSAPFSWGYFDAGAGLSLGDGSWEGGCKTVPRNSRFSDEVCRKDEGFRVGIPLQTTLVFGKFFGLGLSLNMLIQQDARFAQFGFSLPIGDFTTH